VAGRREKASYRVVPGEVVRVEIPAVQKRTIAGEDIPVSVVYEDDALLIVDKPAGMVVHPAPGNWTGTLVNGAPPRQGNLGPADSGKDGPCPPSP
jgi:23S rRNA pseudouridine1911/1915/1917 synthase